jgi:hypothetical protein
MARAAVNPEVLSTPSPQGLELIQMLAADSKTWKKGELVILSSGTVTPLVNSGSTAVYGIFAQDQDTATSSSTVWIRILEIGTRLNMFVMTNGTAATAATAEIGVKYGAEGLSNVSYLDTGTANGQFQVIRTYANKAPLQDGYVDTEAAPGLVEVEFTAVS